MYRAATLAALAVLASACTTMDAEGDTMQTDTAMVSPILTTPEAVDDQTYAQPQVARVTHVALDLDLDFDSQRVGGTATLDVLAKPGAD